MTGKQAAHLRGNALAVLAGNVEIAAGLRSDVRAATDGHQCHRFREIFFHLFIRITGPVTAHAIARSHCSAVARVVGPYRTHAAIGIASGQHRQAVVHRPAALEAESSPFSVFKYPAVAAKTHAALRPVELHRLSRFQRCHHSSLHLVNGKGGVGGLIFLLRVIQAAGPEHGRVASEVGCVVRVSGGDYKAFARDAMFGQTLGQPRG